MWDPSVVMEGPGVTTTGGVRKREELYRVSQVTQMYGVRGGGLIPSALLVLER